MFIYVYPILKHLSRTEPTLPTNPNLLRMVSRVNRLCKTESVEMRPEAVSFSSAVNRVFKRFPLTSSFVSLSFQRVVNPITFKPSTQNPVSSIQNEFPNGISPQKLPTHLLTGAIFPVGSENLHHKSGVLNLKNRATEVSYRGIVNESGANLAL